MTVASGGVLINRGLPEENILPVGQILLIASMNFPFKPRLGRGLRG